MVKASDLVRQLPDAIDRSRRFLDSSRRAVMPNHERGIAQTLTPATALLSAGISSWLNSSMLRSQLGLSSQS